MAAFRRINCSSGSETGLQAGAHLMAGDHLLVGQPTANGIQNNRSVS
jgi:hypothetical protein